MEACERVSERGLFFLSWDLLAVGVLELIGEPVQALVQAVAARRAGGLKRGKEGKGGEGNSLLQQSTGPENIVLELRSVGLT